MVLACSISRKFSSSSPGRPAMPCARRNSLELLLFERISEGRDAADEPSERPESPACCRSPAARAAVRSLEEEKRSSRSEEERRSRPSREKVPPWCVGELRSEPARAKTGPKGSVAPASRGRSRAGS